MLKGSIDKRIEETIEKLDKVFIDDCLRENLGKGYASDTNFYLYAARNLKKYEKIRSWFKKTSQILYLPILKEIVEKIVDKEIKCFWNEENMEEAIRFENSVISLLNRPTVRVVLNKDIEKIQSLNQDLYEKLKLEFRDKIHFDSPSKFFSNQVRTILNKEKRIDSFVDLCFIICAEYEKIPIATFDQGINMILFRYDLPYIDFIKNKLPYDHTFNWAQFLSNQTNSFNNKKILSP